MKLRSSPLLINGMSTKNPASQRLSYSSDEISDENITNSGHRKNDTRTQSLSQSDNQPPKKKRKVDLRRRHWFLTWNNYTQESIRILLGLGAHSYAFQEETGKEKGTPHLQGVFSFIHAKKHSELDNKCKIKAIWAPCRNVGAARNYCIKAPTRTGKQWTKGYKIGQAKVIDPFDGKTPYKWQQEIINIVQQQPDERKVYWYWSTYGNIGKSALIKHLVMKEDAIFVGGKFSAAFYAIKAKTDKGQDPYIVLFDLPRSKGNMISYIAIEGIKNGLIFNSKYESGHVVFNIPHVICMANCEPDYNQLSRDRWQVKCLDNEDDIKI